MSVSPSKVESPKVSPAPPKCQFDFQKIKNTVLNMLIGSFAGVGAVTVVQPCDFYKTRLQLMAEKGIKVQYGKLFGDLVKQEKLLGFYAGLTASWFRQFIFAGIRIGLFLNLCDWAKKQQQTDALPFWQTASFSLGAGAIGIICAMPPDVVMIRMMADKDLPADKRRNYTNIGNGIARIFREEGPGMLWKGWLPAVLRAMALNFGMLAPYDTCKRFLSPFLGMTKINYLLSSFLCGLSASILCLPFDNIKVKLQKDVPGPDGKKRYKGVINCFTKTLRTEGFFSFWTGLPIFWVFVGNHTMLALLISDYLRYILGIGIKK